MKKFIALIQIFILLFSFSAVSVAAEFTDTQDKAVEVIAGLGIMQGYDDGTFLPENTMTRGEFAQLIANIYETGGDDVKAWKEQFFKEESEELALIEEFEKEAVTAFTDVDTNHWAYDAVNTVNSLGFMTGVGNGVFAPDSNITLDQVYKVVICMLGYQVRAVIRGGYPAGYRAVARELKLTNGISSFDNALRGDVARIFYNAFDVELLQLTGVGDSNSYQTIEGETFLTNEIGLSYTEGRMTDNGISDMEGISSNNRNCVVVNNVSIKIDENSDYIRDFLGREVRIYHTNDKKANIQTAVWGSLSGEDEVITFDAADFVDYDLDSISYRDENKKEKNITLASGTKMIYNKTGLSTFTEDNFKINKGTISVVKTGNTADLIIVDSYVSFYVDLVDTLEKKLYSKSTLYEDKIIDLSSEEKSIVIYAADGSVADFDAISAGSVLSVSDSEGFIRIYISGTKVTGYTVTESYKKDNVSYISNGKVKYALSKDMLELKGDIVEVGKTYTVYLDAFKEVVNVTKETETDMKVVFYIAVASSGVFDTDVQIKYYSSEGIMETGYLASKVLLKDVSGAESYYSDLSAVKNIIEKYRGLIRISFNDDKEIDYIELAGFQSQQIGDNEENRLLRIRLNGKDCDPTEKGDSLYWKIHQGFGGVVTIDSSSTKIFQYRPDTKCPDTEHTANGTKACSAEDCIYSSEYKYERPPVDETAFTMAGFGQFGTDDGDVDLWAYTTLGDSRRAEWIVYENDATVSLGVGSAMIIVKSIYKGLDDSGEPTNVIEGYTHGGDEVKFFCEDAVLNDITDMYGRRQVHYGKGEDEVDAKSEFKLEIGDVFRYGAESDGITLNTIQIMFDENAQNPHYAGTNQQGHVVGTTGYYDGTIYSMPNQYGSKDFSTSGNLWEATERRWGLFYKIMWRPGESRFTTYDLSVKDFDLDTFDESKYVIESYASKTTPFLSSIYVIEGDKLTKQGLSEKTYETAGNDVDRVFMATRAGQSMATFTIRGYTGR